jgi:hypothetical protein
LLYRRSLGDNFYKHWELGGLMFVRLAIEIWELDRVELKGEARSGVGEWGKQ